MTKVQSEWSTAGRVRISDEPDFGRDDATEATMGREPDDHPALRGLACQTARLNRIYVRDVANRALRTLPEIAAWRGKRVRVFLRHTTEFVFALSCDDVIGMANSVDIHDAIFFVDETGRQQTLRKEGPLPNGSTVHAWVEGTLIDVSNDFIRCPEGCTAVTFRPAQAPWFVTSPEQLPLFSASEVLFRAGEFKVWVPLRDAASNSVADCGGAR